MDLSLTLLYSTFLAVVVGIMFLYMGFPMIANRFTLALMHRKGYRIFGILGLDGKVREYARKLDDRIRIRGRSYIYNPKRRFAYGSGGNLFVWNKSDAVNVDSVLKEVYKHSQDASLNDTLFTRERSLGKAYKAKEMQMLVIVAIVTMGLAGASAIMSYLAFVS